MNTSTDSFSVETVEDFGWNDFLEEYGDIEVFEQFEESNQSHEINDGGRSNISSQHDVHVQQSTAIGDENKADATTCRAKANNGNKLKLFIHFSLICFHILTELLFAQVVPLL